MCKVFCGFEEPEDASWDRATAKAIAAVTGVIKKVHEIPGDLIYYALYISLER